MKANQPAGTSLHSAIVQLRHVAKKKRAQSLSHGRDKTVFAQEAKQIEEALRLLRWIGK